MHSPVGQTRVCMDQYGCWGMVENLPRWVRALYSCRRNRWHFVIVTWAKDWLSFRGLWLEIAKKRGVGAGLTLYMGAWWEMYMSVLLWVYKGKNRKINNSQLCFCCLWVGRTPSWWAANRVESSSEGILAAWGSLAMRYAGCRGTSREMKVLAVLLLADTEPHEGLITQLP